MVGRIMSTPNTMRSQIEVKSYYMRRMVNRVKRNHLCQNEYHWANLNIKKKRNGFDTKYVQGLCAKDDKKGDFKITKKTNKYKVFTPVIDHIDTIEKQPIGEK